MIKCSPSTTYMKVLNQMNGNKNNNFTDNFTNNFTDNFTNIEIRILELVKNKPTISQSKLAEIIGVSKRTITTNMNNLQEKRILKRIGNNKSGHWEIQN